MYSISLEPATCWLTESNSLFRRFMRLRVRIAFVPEFRLPREVPGYAMSGVSAFQLAPMAFPMIVRIYSVAPENAFPSGGIILATDRYAKPFL